MYIKKEVASKKIAQKYRPIVSDVKKSLLNFAPKIHSIYLYGSVATGKAKSPASDLDILIVLKRKVSKQLTIDLKEVERTLSLKYAHVLREVGFSLTNVNEVKRGKETYAWKFFISTLCLLIQGKAVLEEKYKFKPTKKLARSLYRDLKQDLSRSRKEIASAKNTAKPTKHIMKALLRVSFFTIMEEANNWTTDLRQMAAIFLEYHPEKRPEISAIQKLIETPTNRKEAIHLIDTYGKWIAKKYYAL